MEASGALLFCAMLSLTMMSVNDTAEAPVENDSPSGPNMVTLSLPALAAFSSSKRMIDCPNEELKATESKSTDRKQDFILWLLASNGDGCSSRYCRPASRLHAAHR
jgi:hypothetical protein